MKPITIFTDGASRRNPGPGGWGAVVATDAKVFELGGGDAHTTNNRMELGAVIGALRFLVKSFPRRNLGTNSAEESPLKTFVTLYTDSSYVLNGATKWIHGWKNTGWKTKSKDDVLNKDLWGIMAELLPHFQIDWKLLKGHAGIPANERCDVIATSFADEKRVDLYEGTLGNYEINIEQVDYPKTSTKASKSKARKGTAYSYVSELGGKVQTHKTWAECEKRVKGKSGARFKKAFSKEDEAAIISTWSTPHAPQT